MGLPDGNAVELRVRDGQTGRRDALYKAIKGALERRGVVGISYAKRR